MKHSSYAIHDIGIFAAITLVTLAWASTTDATYELFASVRLVLIALVVIAVASMLIRQFSKLRIIALCSFIISLFCIYSLLLLRIHAPSALPSISSYFVLTILAAAIFSLFYLAPENRPIIAAPAAWMYIFFSLVILAVTVLMGGLLLDGFPSFVYSYTTIEGSLLTYSQGVSKFYGLAAILTAGLVSDTRNFLFWRLFCGSLLILFLLLSLIGGGRGDFVFALLISLLRLRKKYFLALAAAGFLLVLPAAEILERIVGEYSSLATRYAALLDSYGMRDRLFFESVSLLLSEPTCLLLGCGIGFFQSYYDYPPGLYPHNVPLEFLISFGVVFCFPLVILILLGFKNNHLREGPASHFSFVFLYFLLVSLKSGSLLTSYILIGAAAFLALKGLNNITLTRRK